MEASFFESKRKLQTNTPITILTIISLVLTVICSLDGFTSYYTSGNDDVWKLEFSLGYSIIDIIFSLLSYVISVAPVILFAIYIFKFYRQFQADVAIPISLGLIAFKPIYYLINNLILGYGFSSMLDILVDFIVVVSFTLATISSLKGFSKKIYIIIAVVCGVLSELVSLISFIGYIARYIEDGLYLYLFTWPLAIIGSIALYMALLFFSLNNKMPVAIKKEKNTEKMNPEQALRVLKDKLDFGTITEEEYQAKRAEIISKL